MYSNKTGSVILLVLPFNRKITLFDILSKGIKELQEKNRIII